MDEEKSKVKEIYEELKKRKAMYILEPPVCNPPQDIFIKETYPSIDKGVIFNTGKPENESVEAMDAFLYVHNKEGTKRIHVERADVIDASDYSVKGLLKSTPPDRMQAIWALNTNARPVCFNDVALSLANNDFVLLDIKVLFSLNIESYEDAEAFWVNYEGKATDATGYRGAKVRAITNTVIMEDFSMELRNSFISCTKQVQSAVEAWATISDMIIEAMNRQQMVMAGKILLQAVTVSADFSKMESMLMEQSAKEVDIIKKSLDIDLQVKEAESESNGHARIIEAQLKGDYLTRKATEKYKQRAERRRRWADGSRFLGYCQDSDIDCRSGLDMDIQAPDRHSYRQLDRR